jgi:hypothetical protein
MKIKLVKAKVNSLPNECLIALDKQLSAEEMNRFCEAIEKQFPTKKTIVINGKIKVLRVRK